MSKRRFQILIQRSPEAVYSLLTDLRGYQSWLPPSDLYTSVQEISDTPIMVGTTYTDGGQRTRLHGQVTALIPDRAITFVQHTDGRLFGIPGKLHIQIHYDLEPAGAFSTLVIRTVTISCTGVFFLLQPLLLPAIHKENGRILQYLKRYLEAR